MTGPEHYVLAEMLLNKSHADALTIARTQVHATLALAAATAMAAPRSMRVIDAEAWGEAAGVHRVRVAPNTARDGSE